MLEEIILEIEEMEYPNGDICQGLIAEGIHDRGAAAAYGFGRELWRLSAATAMTGGHTAETERTCRSSLVMD